MREEKRGSRSSRIVERNSGNSVMTPKDLCYTSLLVITNFVYFYKKNCVHFWYYCVWVSCLKVYLGNIVKEFCEVSPFEIHGDLIVLNLVLGSLQFWQSSIKTYFVIVFFVYCCLCKPGLLSSFLMVLVSHMKTCTQIQNQLLQCMNPRPKEIHNGNINLASPMPCTYVMIRNLITPNMRLQISNKQ
jgi:hypothetical protein